MILNTDLLLKSPAIRTSDKNKLMQGHFLGETLYYNYRIIESGWLKHDNRVEYIRKGVIRDTFMEYSLFYNGETYLIYKHEANGHPAGSKEYEEIKNLVQSKYQEALKNAEQDKIICFLG